MKRVTPEQDYERLAERLNHEFGDMIRDRETFDHFYERYMDDGEVPEDHGIRDRDSRDAVFDFYTGAYRIGKKNLFERAGGKDYKRDIRQTASTVVTTEKEYIKKGAQRVDLKGYDTKNVTKFVYRGRQRGKIRYARELKTKRGIRYIDKKGRYVSIRRK